VQGGTPWIVYWALRSLSHPRTGLGSAACSWVECHTLLAARLQLAAGKEAGGSPARSHSQRHAATLARARAEERRQGCGETRCRSRPRAPLGHAGNPVTHPPTHPRPHPPRWPAGIALTLAILLHVLLPSLPLALYSILSTPLPPSIRFNSFPVDIGLGL
jgi:hypothetical protein